jgi:hypothetical protein
MKSLKKKVHSHIAAEKKEIKRGNAAMSYSMEGKKIPKKYEKKNTQERTKRVNELFTKTKTKKIAQKHFK